MDLGVPVAGDNRRLDVVVDGLPLRGGVQLAVDTTLVSSVRGSGETRRSNHGRCGLDPSQEMQREDPQGVDRPQGPGLAWWFSTLEVGGRWSVEAKSFVGQLAKAHASVQATSAPVQDGTGVKTEVVLHPLVCRGSFVCHVSPWSEGDNRCFWPRTDAA